MENTSRRISDILGDAEDYDWPMIEWPYGRAVRGEEQWREEIAKLRGRPGALDKVFAKLFGHIKSTK